MANVVLSEIRITVLLITVQSHPRNYCCLKTARISWIFFAYIMLERTTQARGIEKIDSWNKCILVKAICHLHQQLTLSEVSWRFKYGNYWYRCSLAHCTKKIVREVRHTAPVSMQLNNSDSCLICGWSRFMWCDYMRGWKLEHGPGRILLCVHVDTKYDFIGAPPEMYLAIDE